jgi:hypothetical protein
MAASRPGAYIVTIKRDAAAAPESYYMHGLDAGQARNRAMRMAKATRDQVVDVVASW